MLDHKTSSIVSNGLTRGLRFKTCVILIALLMNMLTVGERTISSAAEPDTFQSKNFLLHTDIGPKGANELLEKLETMLRLISKYWAKPNQKLIECYVVEDLKNWPSGVLHPNGVAKIARKEGVTLTTTLTRGNQFVAKSMVYSSADLGVAQHEAVHAYCGQNFGRTGPRWYAEGMAEMGQYWREDDPAVHCHQYVEDYIRKSTPRSLNEIVNENEASVDGWEDYAWRWALCHLLANNPNYQKRFRPLGLALLTGKDTSFEQVYGAMAKEISFEYLFFLNHFKIGYRVDLCSWNWKAKFRAPRGTSGTSARIEAGEGWQASQVLLLKDLEYEYSSTGLWTLEKDGEEIDANGLRDGRGKLEGIIFEDYELSEPFELGAEGKFTAPQDGTLFLRCKEDWGKIADNKGRVTVRIKKAD